MAERTKEVALLQKELKSVNEFRKNKAKITEEIKEMREQLAAQKAENEKNKQRMEHEFFVEKMKMEREVRVSGAYRFIYYMKFYINIFIKIFNRLAKRLLNMRRKLRKKRYQD